MPEKSTFITCELVLPPDIVVTICPGLSSIESEPRRPWRTLTGRPAHVSHASEGWTTSEASLASYEGSPVRQNNMSLEPTVLSKLKARVNLSPKISKNESVVKSLVAGSQPQHMITHSVQGTYGTVRYMRSS